MLALSLATSGASLSILLALGACLDDNATSDSSLDSPFQITILSSNGTDLTSSFPILHSLVPPSTLQPRASTPKPIEYCPPDGRYTARSWCRHEDSPQRYKTLCAGPPQARRSTTPQHTLIEAGTCAPDELCVGSDSLDGAPPTMAYCVATEHFVPVGPGSHVVTAAFHADALNGSRVGVEAVLTGPNKATSVVAASMVLQAQAHPDVWRTVPGGRADCLRCASVALTPFPWWVAQRVKVNVVLEEGSDDDGPVGGLLWLASYPF